MTLEGIDIAYPNANPKLRGLDFVIAKASEGMFIDPRWAEHVRAIKAARLPFGAYHFGRSEESASAQADLFLRTAADADFLALDWEPSSHGTLMGASEARLFIKHVHAAGRRIGLYAAEHFPREYPPDAFGADFRWVANFVRRPRVPFDIWQWNGAGIDRDRFEGTLAEFRARVIGTAPVPPGDVAVKFMQLSAADLAGLQSIDVPAGTPLEDFAGEQWDTIGPTSVRVLPGLVDAHTNRRAAVVSTARYYDDGKARPTAQVVVLKGG